MNEKMYCLALKELLLSQLFSAIFFYYFKKKMNFEILVIIHLCINSITDSRAVIS